MFDKGFLQRFFNSDSIQFVLLSIALYIFTLYEYKVFVFELYEYMGFRYEFNLTKSIISLLVFFSSFFFLYIQGSEFSKSISAIFHTLFLMPILVIYQFHGLPILFVLCMIILLFIINYSGVNLKLPMPPNISTRQRSLLLTFICLVCIIPFLISFKINLDPSLFKMGEETYDIRGGLDDSWNIFTAYMITPLVQVLLPICAVYGLKEKNFLLVLFSVLSSLTLFLMIPQKSVFFGIFVILFFYFIPSTFKKVIVFNSLLLTLFVLGKLLVLLDVNLVLESLFLRRFLLLPAMLNAMYFETFLNAPLYFSHSFLSSFIDYPYEFGPANMVGVKIFGNIETHANNGFLSDGYMNMGWLGMVFFTFIVGFIIKFFDALNLDPKYFGLFFLLLNVFRSSALFTSIATHGIWLLALLAYLVLFERTRIKNTFL